MSFHLKIFHNIANELTIPAENQIIPSAISGLEGSSLDWAIRSMVPQ